MDNNHLKGIKNLLVWISFGVPMTLFHLDFSRYWPTEWGDIFSTSNLIQLIWCSIVPLTACILITMEAHGDEFKENKYYYCATFFVYEFIGFVSVFTYIYLLTCEWPNAKTVEFLHNLLFERNSSTIVWLLCVISSYIILCFLWFKNTVAHLSLCRYKTLTVNTLEEKIPHIWCRYEILPTFFYSWRKPVGSWHGFDCDRLLSHWHFGVLPALTIIFVGLDSLDEVILKNFLWKHIYGILAVEYVFKTRRYDPNDGYTLIIKQKTFVCFLGLVYFILESGGYPDLFGTDIVIKRNADIHSLLCWLCSLTAGRRWFLDIEIHPEIYEDNMIANNDHVIVDNNEDRVQRIEEINEVRVPRDIGWWLRPFEMFFSNQGSQLAISP